MENCWDNTLEDKRLSVKKIYFHYYLLNKEDVKKLPHVKYQRVHFLYECVEIEITLELPACSLANCMLIK